jgi:hypothetical protein
VSTPFRYYKKRERFEKYMEACANGGLLTSEQAVKAHYDFTKLWREFTRQQKARYQKVYNNRQREAAGVAPRYVVDAAASVQSDVNFWERAFARARGR